MARGKKDDANVVINGEDKTGAAFKSAQQNMRNLASSAAILEGPLGKVAGRINALGAALGRMSAGWIGVGVTTAAFLVGLKTSLEAAGKLEQQMLRLNAVLIATGREGETSAREIDDFARTLGEVTLTSADQVRDAAGALATFKNIDTRQMQTVLTLAQDMSAVFGGDLRTNSIKLARALDNPREGLSGLSRNILATSSAWRNLTADMFESGDKLQAQSAIIEQIQQKVAGAGTAEAGGLVGALDTLGERWTTVLEAFGNTAVMQAATWAVQELSDALAVLRGWLEEDEKAAALFNEKLKPYEETLMAMGISIKNIDPENLYDVQRVVKQIELLGADLAESQPFVKLANEIIATEASIRQYQKAYDDQVKSGMAVTATHEYFNRVLTQQKQKLKETTDAYNALAKGKALNVELDAILIEKANKFSEKYGKKALSPLENAQKEMLELRVDLAKVVGEDAPMAAKKLGEVEAAYLAFVLKLHNEATEKAQDRIDKAIAVQESRLDRLKKALGEEQGKSGFTDQRQFDSTQSERDKIAAQEALEIEAADRRYARLEAEGKASNELYAQIEAEKILIHQTSEEKRRQLTEEAEQSRRDAWTSALGHVEGLLGELGKESKQAAVASIALSKGLAIAQIFANTEVAAMRALAEAGPFAGPGIAASIRSAGAVSMAAVAATGLLQARAALQGSGSGGGGSRPSASTPEITPLEDTKDRGSVVLQFMGPVYGWDKYIEDKVIAGIKDAVDNKDLIIIGSGSRQAQELTF